MSQLHVAIINVSLITKKVPCCEISSALDKKKITPTVFYRLHSWVDESGFLWEGGVRGWCFTSVRYKRERFSRGWQAAREQQLQHITSQDEQHWHEHEGQGNQRCLTNLQLRLNMHYIYIHVFIVRVFKYLLIMMPRPYLKHVSQLPRKTTDALVFCC